MRKKKAALSAKNDLTCKDCQNHFDPHHMSNAGKPIFCKCRISQYKKLLNHDKCSDISPIITDK